MKQLKKCLGIVIMAVLMVGMVPLTSLAAAPDVTGGAIC